MWCSFRNRLPFSLYLFISHTCVLSIFDIHEGGYVYSLLNEWMYKYPIYGDIILNSYLNMHRQYCKTQSANHWLTCLSLETMKVMVIFSFHNSQTLVHLNHFHNLFCVRHDFPILCNSTSKSEKQSFLKQWREPLTHHIFCVTHQLKSVICSISSDLPLPSQADVSCHISGLHTCL